MAPHWKCGSRHRVAGSTPALSATRPGSGEVIRARGAPPMSSRQALDVVALPMGEFTFGPDDPWPGQTGVVVAYAVRHPGGVFLFDTGFAARNPELDEFYATYDVRPQALPELPAAGGNDPRE